MKHNLRREGYCYRLRPVKLEDAEFIIKIRLEDRERTKYIHEIPNDIESEKQWIEKYFERPGDYFFVVEDKFINEKVGLIAIYDEENGSAEWGRWVIKQGSLAAVESVCLLYQIAFDQLQLRELYCRTVEDNQSVVNFHASTGLKVRKIHEKMFELRGDFYNAVEQYIDRDLFYNSVETNLNQKSFMLFKRVLKKNVGKFEFDHIGIACKNIVKEMQTFQMLGYQFEAVSFKDDNQGIIGRFGTAQGQPKIELLSNMEGSATLDPYLEKGIKMYHFAYLVNDIQKASCYLEKCNAKLMSPRKRSIYFGKDICFYMLPNMMLIELVEV